MLAALLKDAIHEFMRIPGNRDALQSMINFALSVLNEGRQTSVPFAGNRDVFGPDHATHLLKRPRVPFQKGSIVKTSGDTACQFDGWRYCYHAADQDNHIGQAAIPWPFWQPRDSFYKPALVTAR